MRLLATLFLLALALPTLASPVLIPGKEKSTERKSDNPSRGLHKRFKFFNNCINPIFWITCAENAIWGDGSAIPGIDLSGHKPGNVVAVKRSDSESESEASSLKEKKKPKGKPKKKEKPKPKKKPLTRPDGTPRPPCPARDLGEMTLCHFSLGLFCNEKHNYHPPDCVTPEEAAGKEPAIVKRSESKPPTQVPKKGKWDDGTYPEEGLIESRDVPPTQYSSQGKWNDGTFPEEELINTF